jgi:hypothetical protein
MPREEKLAICQEKFFHRKSKGTREKSLADILSQNNITVFGNKAISYIISPIVSACLQQPQ